MGQPSKGIPIAVQVIGWSFVVWAVGSYFTSFYPQNGTYAGPNYSMMFLHLVLGIVFVLVGVALYRLTNWNR